MHINYGEQCLCMYEAIRHVNREIMKSARMCACLRWPSLDCFEKLICVELGNYKLIFTTESFRLCWETNISISVHPNVSPFTQKKLPRTISYPSGWQNGNSISLCEPSSEETKRREKRREKAFTVSANWVVKIPESRSPPAQPTTLEEKWNWLKI